MLTVKWWDLYVSAQSKENNCNCKALGLICHCTIKNMLTVKEWELYFRAQLEENNVNCKIMGVICQCTIKNMLKICSNSVKEWELYFRAQYEKDSFNCKVVDVICQCTIKAILTLNQQDSPVCGPSEENNGNYSAMESGNYSVCVDNQNFNINSKVVEVICQWTIINLMLTIQ